MLARPPSANYAWARLARLGIHPAHPRPPPAGLPAVSSRRIALNCQQLKSTSSGLCLHPRLTADLLVVRGFLRVVHAGHDVCPPAVRRP